MSIFYFINSKNFNVSLKRENKRVIIKRGGGGVGEEITEKREL